MKTIQTGVMPMAKFMFPLLALFGCSTYRPATRSLATPPPSARNWDEAFAHPRPVSVESWLTGEVKVDRAGESAEVAAARAGEGVIESAVVRYSSPARWTAWASTAPRPCRGEDRPWLAQLRAFALQYPQVKLMYGHEAP
jgi:hypothetical protein